MMASDYLTLMGICHLWLPHALPIFWFYLTLHALPSQGYYVLHVTCTLFPRIETRKLVFLDSLAAREQVWDLVSTNWLCPCKTWIRQWAMWAVIRSGALYILVITVMAASTSSELLVSRDEWHWGGGAMAVTVMFSLQQFPYGIAGHSSYLCGFKAWLSGPSTASASHLTSL